MNRWKKWGKVVPINNQAPYDPKTLMHHISEKYPKMKALAVIVQDEDDQVVIHISDMHMQLLAFMGYLLTGYIQKKVLSE